MICALTFLIPKLSRVQVLLHIICDILANNFLKHFIECHQSRNWSEVVRALGLADLWHWSHHLCLQQVRPDTITNCLVYDHCDWLG